MLNVLSFSQSWSFNLTFKKKNSLFLSKYLQNKIKFFSHTFPQLRLSIESNKNNWIDCYRLLTSEHHIVINQSYRALCFSYRIEASFSICRFHRRLICFSSCEFSLLRLKKQRKWNLPDAISMERYLTYLILNVICVTCRFPTERLDNESYLKNDCSTRVFTTNLCTYN